jgi:hypothetical protein
MGITKVLYGKLSNFVPHWHRSLYFVFASRRWTLVACRLYPQDFFLGRHVGVYLYKGIFDI